MPLLIRGLFEEDGVTPIRPETMYIVSGAGTSGYFRYPGMPWDTLQITANEVSIPDRDFANAIMQPPRSQLAELVDRGLVQVWDTTLPGFLTGDQIRDYA